MHGSLGLSEFTSQTASRSVQPFFEGSRSWPTDRPTVHATPSVAVGCTQVALRCGLKTSMSLSEVVAIIKTSRPLREFIRFIWWMQIWRQMAANPLTERPSFCRQLYSLQSTIAIYYYYIGGKLVFVLPSHGGWKVSTSDFVCGAIKAGRAKY